VYRGIAGMSLPDEFWQPNEFGVKGGIENAFMSTTTQRGVAMSYAKGDGQRVGIVLEMRQGMVDRGANIGWLSQYAHEEEFLFGPLTGIEVLGTRTDSSILIVEVTFSVNLTALTLEQVLGKRKGLVENMMKDMRSEALQLWPPLLGPGGDARMAPQLREMMPATRESEWYNNNQNFLAAVQEVVKVQDGIIARADEVRTLLHAAMSRLDWKGATIRACPNNHPYFIGGCGVIIPNSRCPECRVELTGSECVWACPLA